MKRFTDLLNDPRFRRSAYIVWSAISALLIARGVIDADTMSIVTSLLGGLVGVLAAAFVPSATVAADDAKPVTDTYVSPGDVVQVTEPDTTDTSVGGEQE